MASRILPRLVPAAGVALAVALLGFGAIGMATASSDPGDKGLPATFRLAERHAGDRGVLRTIWDEGNGQTSEARASFLWLEEQAFLDGRDGTWRAAHGRLVDFEHDSDLTAGGMSFEVDSWWMTWHATATHAVVGHTGAIGAAVGTSVSFGAAGLPVTQRQSYMSAYQGTYWTDTDDCSLQVRLASGVRLDEPITFPESCAAEGQPTPVYLARPSEVDGIPTVRFEWAFEQDVAVHREAEEYAHGIPEPLLVESVSSIGDQVTYRYATILEGFEAGTGAWDTSIRLPAPLTLPPVELAPREPWGPSEAGVQHPFPASQAWARARDDPTFAEFRDYLARNPDAVAAYSEYQQERDGNRTHRTWDFTLWPDAQGPDGGFFLQVTQTVGPAGAAVTDLLGLPAKAPQETTEYAVWGGDRSFGPPLELALELPTVSSTMRRWQAHTGSTEPANAWGVEPRLASAGLVGFQMPAMQVSDYVTGTERTGNGTFVHLQVDANGAAYALVQVESSLWRQVGGSPPPQAVQADAQPDLEASRVVLAGMAWTPPSTPAASGAAAVSLLAGLLYWLWPAIKGGAVGLFSRIESPRLLDHPLRRAIVDVVEAQPGIHYQAVLRTVGGGKGAVEHHLRKLVDGGLIKRHQGPGYTCFFPVGTDHRVAAAAGLLKAEGARRVLAAAQKRPGLTSADLAAATGLDPSTVSHHVHRLAGAGLLRTTRAGRTLAIEPTGLAGPAMAGVGAA